MDEALRKRIRAALLASRRAMLDRLYRNYRPDRDQAGDRTLSGLSAPADSEKSDIPFTREGLIAEMHRILDLLQLELEKAERGEPFSVTTIFKLNARLRDIAEAGVRHGFWAHPA